MNDEDLEVSQDEGVSADGVSEDATDPESADEAWYRNPAVIVAAVVVGLVLLALLFVAIRSGSDEPGRSSEVTATGDPRLDRALTLHLQGETEEAAVIYQEILQVNPANEYAAYNLGVIAQTEGRLGEALEYYNRAISVDPAFFSAAYNRALTLRDLGQTDLALEAFEGIVDQRDLFTDEEVAKTLFNYGNLLIAQGDVEQGEKLVREATGIDSRLRAND